MNTGDYTNISDSDSIGHHNYNFECYEVPYGLAWSPKENIIAFVGGCKADEEPFINIVLLYHLDMDLGRQAPSASSAYTDVPIYGIKWDIDGKSIYYVVDSFDDENKYSLYQTEIETEKVLAGRRMEEIDRLTNEELRMWLSKY